MTVNRGKQFTHATRLDPDWKPEPGQKYVDAPHEEMVVTRVANGRVYFRPATGGTSTYLLMASFLATYGDLP